MRKDFLKVGHTFSTDCSDYMRKLIATFTALALGVSLLLASGGVGYAQDFNKGLAAYDSGDYETAFHEFRPLAEQGDARAQYNLAQMHREGRGVIQDYKEAANWYRKAAEQGIAVAQYNLAQMHREGWGVIQDYKEAANWYRKAAEQGIAVAQYNLGWMYSKGKGVTQDYKEAVKWFRKATEQGLADAQYNLGWMYGNGKGVILDYVYAHMWLNIAAANFSKTHVALRDRAVALRDKAAKRMTPSQLEKAQELARQCVAKKYKGC